MQVKVFLHLGSLLLYLRPWVFRSNRSKGLILIRAHLVIVVRVNANVLLHDHLLLDILNRRESDIRPLLLDKLLLLQLSVILSLLHPTIRVKRFLDLGL